jgi:hypothetical protein
MTNVVHVKFPNKSKRKKPRQRVFYLGQYYAGPPLCQSLEKLWIKRKPNNRWTFLQYHYGKAYEQEEYDGDDILDVLQSIPFVDEVTFDDLLQMGWYHKGEIVDLNDLHLDDCDV